MSDHSHYGEYAEARHDHRGEYAPDRHDHDLDYAEKHHRHYDDERAVGELQREVRELGAALAVYAQDLSEALGRIRQLEQQTPQARQLQLEADQAAADLAESESWRSTLADYQVATGAAEYDDEPGDEWCPETLDGEHTAFWHEGGQCAACGLYGPRDDGEPGVAPFVAVPRLRRVLCTRIVSTDGNPEPCGLPVDHDPDEKCPGNPHARPAPEASQP